MLIRIARHRDPGLRGFTLIELLVSMGVIALLIALAIPVLSLARLAAQRSVSLFNLRGIGQSTSRYIESYRTHPYGLTGPGRPPGTGTVFYVGFTPWTNDRYWPVLFHDVAPWPEFSETWISPGAPDQDRFRRLWEDCSLVSTTDIRPSYRYSNSFVGDPHLWGDRFDPAVHDARPTRPHEVSLPAQKAMFIDEEPPSSEAMPTRRGVLSADGSARTRRDDDSGALRENPRCPEVSPRRYHDTVDGIHGQDF